MKAIFYIGAALMIGASIYGFVDYKKVSRSELFNKMYDEKQQTTPGTPKTEKKPASREVMAAKQEKERPHTEVRVTSPTKLQKAGKAKTTKKIHYKEFSRAPLREKTEIIHPANSKE